MHSQSSVAHTFTVCHRHHAVVHVDSPTRTAPVNDEKMPKLKSCFTDEMRKKYPYFRQGRDKWEAECTVCKAGTYVSVANKGSSDLQAHIATTKHKTAVRGETSSAKLTDFSITEHICLFCYLTQTEEKCFK